MNGVHPEIRKEVRVPSLLLCPWARHFTYFPAGGGQKGLRAAVATIHSHMYVSTRM